MPSPSPASRIAAGGQPDPWRETFTHPVHGELTFVAGLPGASQLVRHSVAIDNLLSDLGDDVEPRMSTKILAAAVAGMADSLMMEMPVIDRREEDDDERGSTKVVLIKYDPAAEPNTGWLTDVWLAYSLWRSQFLTPTVATDVGNASGRTTQPDSDTESGERGASLSTTPE